MTDPLSILHISDLHRSPEDPISNEELVSALLHDRDRYVGEAPPIAAPTAIVISGDLIEGVRLGTENFERRMEEQYAVAEDLLNELVARFLDGDRSRLIMVPGNHDVDWNTAFAALERVEPSEFSGNLGEELRADDALLRWDWNTRTLYRIVRRDVYARRLDPFWRLCERFYSGLDVPREVHGSFDARLYDLFEGVIGMAAFNSCDGNDCFAYHGRIKPGSVAGSDLGLRDGGAAHDLRVAVWHHNIEGSPYRTDYMDVNIVRGMIGRGFRLGLHGHQHKAQVGSQEIRLPNLESMAVIGAGSLCAGWRQLPTGTHRQYNVVELAPDLGSVRTHVRAMAVANVFSRASLPEFGGASYMDLPLSSAKDAVGQPIDLTAKRRDRTIGMAEAEAKSARPDRAVQILRRMELPPGTHERQLFLDAAEQAKDWMAVVAATDPPTSIPEIVLRFRAQCELEDHEGADQTVVSRYSGGLGLPGAVQADLRGRLKVRKAMKG